MGTVHPFRRGVRRASWIPSVGQTCAWCGMLVRVVIPGPFATVIHQRRADGHVTETIVATARLKPWTGELDAAAAVMQGDDQ